jgi:hypothetical protein
MGWQDAEIVGGEQIEEPAVIETQGAIMPPQWSGADIVQKYHSGEQTPQARAATEELSRRGLLDLIGERATERGQAIAESAERRIGEGGIVKALFEAPTIAATTAGQAAGLAGDIGGEIIKKGVGAITPEPVKEAVKGGLKDALDTPIGQAALKLFEVGGDAWGSFKESYPDAALAIEGGVNLATLGGGAKVAKETGKVATLAGKEAADIGTDIINIASKRMPEAIEKDLDNVISSHMMKAVRPSVAGKKSYSQFKKTMADSKDAVKAIVANKENLNLTDEFGDVVEGLPQNLRHFSQAIENTKKHVFSKYDELAEASGENVIDMTGAKKALEEIVDNKSLQIANPGASAYAAERLKALEGMDLTAREAQDAIAALNSKLDSFYKSPDYNAASNAVVDSVLANNIRKSVDDMIETASGPSYGELKKQYGSLKAIEKDVLNRAIVDARKNAKGLIDFTDIFSGAQAVSALSGAGLPAMAQAATAKGIASYWKRLNDPNRYVKRMFSKTEDLMKKSEGFTPESKLGKKLVQGAE